MAEKPCAWLDDYLAHDLPGDETARFMAHLPDCEACARMVREHDRLADLLQRAIDLAPVPEGLQARISGQWRVARRRHMMVVAASLAASVAAVFALTRWLASSEKVVEAPERTHEVVEQKFTAPPEKKPPIAEEARVTFPPDSGIIAVPVPVNNPDLIVYWVYRGMRQSEPADEAQTTSSERNEP